MWQLYAFASLIASSGESIIDKFALVSHKRIDSLVATFWRLVMFTCCIWIFFSLTGIFGGITWNFTPLIWLVGLFGIANSLSYTFLLRRVEVTGIGAIFYLSPFLFLVIDTSVLHTALTPGEITGIFFMVFGGLAFAMDGKTHRFKREFSIGVWSALLLMIAYSGIEAYAFKFLHTTQALNSPSFFASTALVNTCGLLFFAMATGRSTLMFNKSALSYIPRITLSKCFDIANSVLWAQALTLAAVSQVSAMEALEPLVLFVVTIVAQSIFSFRLEERLERPRVRWKAAAVCMLVIGGLMVT